MGQIDSFSRLLLIDDDPAAEMATGTGRDLATATRIRCQVTHENILFL